MGQRSQIYIKFNNKSDEVTKLYAKYFPWNYGERMISRARHGIEYIKKCSKYIENEFTQEKINRIFDVNFDMKDIIMSSDLMKEWLEDFKQDCTVNDFIFDYAANNDGKLFIDVKANGEIKMCFTDCNLKILSPEEYIYWDIGILENSKFLSEDDVEKCKNNIKYINDNVKYMTQEELNEFINLDYSKQVNELEESLKMNQEPVVTQCNTNMIQEVNQDEVEIDL